MDLKELGSKVEADVELHALHSWMADELKRQDRKDPGHDLSHSYRVALWTLRLGRGFSFRAAVAAALLHDLVNPPKNSPDRARASELSALRAKEILPRFGLSGPELDDICAAIRTHSFSRGEDPVSELGRALQDADRLEALGAIGLYRVLATGVLMGGELFHGDDPWARERELDDKRYSVDHFFQKLLKLPATMKTQLGRQEAERRVEYLVSFLRQLGEEIGVPYSRG